MPFKNNDVNKLFILLTLVGVVGASVLGVVFSKENAAIILGFSAVITGQLLTMLQQDRNATAAADSVKEVAAKAEIVAEKADEFKEVLKSSGDRSEHKLDSIHALVNNAMAMQLKVNMLLSRELAIAKPNSSTHAVAAEEAERLYKDHMAKQANIDIKQAGIDNQ